MKRVLSNKKGVFEVPLRAVSIVITIIVMLTTLFAGALIGYVLWRLVSSDETMRIWFILAGLGIATARLVQSWFKILRMKARPSSIAVPARKKRRY